MLFGFAAVGLGLANAVPILFNAAGKLATVPPSIGIAAVSTAGYCGFLLGPPVIGLVSERFGLGTGLGLVVIARNDCHEWPWAHCGRRGCAADALLTAVAGSRAMGPTPLAPRQVSPDHTRAIAETGGAVGVWHFFASLEKYVDGLKEMADIVGVDHVSIGTDQFDARGCVVDYTKWVHLVAAMLRGGFTAAEAGKIAGGNYLRIFRAAVG
jgi:hypothetical protein